MTKDTFSEQENTDKLLPFTITEDTNNIYILNYVIPKSNNKENFKVREQIVWSIYGQWQAQHEEKKQYNIALKSDILIRFEGISETVQKAARNYKYTMAMCAFDEILQYAVEVKRDKPKKEVENQCRYKEMIIMNLKTAAFKSYFENIKMTVGVVRSNESKKIQYCITTIEQ
jgi:hypothetical protein